MVEQKKDNANFVYVNQKVVRNIDPKGMKITTKGLQQERFKRASTATVTSSITSKSSKTDKPLAKVTHKNSRHGRSEGIFAMDDDDTTTRGDSGSSMKNRVGRTSDVKTRIGSSSGNGSSSLSATMQSRIGRNNEERHRRRSRSPVRDRIANQPSSNVKSRLGVRR